MRFVAPSPVDALVGVMALTPTPSGYCDDAEDDSTEAPAEGLYHRYIHNLTLSGAARGCTCDQEGCHCDGIADMPLEPGVCGCCLVDCPTAHGDDGSD